MSVRRAGALSASERADWANYARHVAPLRGRTRPELPEPAVSDASAEAAPVPRRPRPTPPPPLTIGEQPPGVDNATWNRLRSGRLKPARSVDLHGHSVPRAYQTLLAALRGAHAERLRCIEVITGRGRVPANSFGGWPGAGETGGAIRRELPLWLNLPELRALVLAAAHPHPDNPGATRLLLRRPR